MSLSRAQALFIAHTVLTPSALEDGHLPEEIKGGEEIGPTTGASSAEWNAMFVKTVMPAIKQGYKYITETRDHEIDMVGYAKIMVDEFSEEYFDSIVTAIASPELNWGRIVAFFTLLSFVSTELAAKNRQDDVAILKGWFVKFLCQNDFSMWIDKGGEWTNTISEGGKTASQWSWLTQLKDFIFGHSVTTEKMMQRDRNVDHMPDRTRNSQRLQKPDGKEFCVTFPPSLTICVSNEQRGTSDQSSILDKKPELGQLYKFEYEDNGHIEEMEVIPMLAPDWKIFGAKGIGLKDYNVEACKGKDDVDSCYKLFQLFFKNGSKKFKRPTWRNTIQAMRDSNFSVCADELEKALPHMK